MWFNDPNAAKPPVIPAIAQAFQNDPRTKLGQQIMANGSSTAPVAGYGYGVPDGIARMLQGLAGGLIAKQQNRSYQRDEKQFSENLKAARIAAALGMPGQAGQMMPAEGQGAAMPPPAAFAPPPQPQAPQGMPQAPQGMPQAPQGAQPPVDPRMIAQQGGQQAPFGPTPASNVALANSRGAPVSANSFRSTIYDDAEEKAAQATGVPKQLISAIRLYGERSNVNQVSSAGARSVYQFTPPTRKLFMAKYGVDPWKDPQSGAMAAALHLKESLARNNGDTGSAIGEYIGGPDRSKWGKVTNAYVKRVQRSMGGENGTDSYTANGGNNSRMAQQAEYDPYSSVRTPAPAAVAEPDKPEAETATKSYRMAMANAMLDTDNRYMVGDAMKMLDEGMGEQLNADEAAAARRQGLTDKQYQARINRSENSQQAAEGDVYAQRAGERGYGFQRNINDRNNNFQRELQDDTQDFTAGQTEQQYRNNWNLNAQQSDLGRGAAADQYWYNKDLTGDRNDGRLEARRAAWSNNGTNAKFEIEVGDRVSANADALSQLSEFESILGHTKTGGFILGNAPGLQTWSSTDLQRLRAITERMSISLSKDLKGAISDKEGERIKASLADIAKTGRANAGLIQFLRGSIQRAIEFDTQRLEARKTDQYPQFLRQWAQYRENVPAQSDTTFDQWKSGQRGGGTQSGATFIGWK